MRRRDFIKAVGSCAALWPCAAAAQQQPAVRRIGLLMPFAENAPEAPPRIAAFREALPKLGWIEGRNLLIDYRWVPQIERIPAAAKALVEQKPDLLVVLSDPAAAALQRESRSIPIVFVSVGDPLGGGFIESLAKPGGNMTGFINFEPTMGGKWLDLLREIAPGITRALVVMQREVAAHANFLRAIQAAAPTLKIAVTAESVHNAAEIEAAINSFPAELGGMLVLPHPLTAANQSRIIGLAAQRRLPAVYPFRFFAIAGGLVSYGTDQVDQFRLAAGYIDRILKGEKPANLPAQASNKFELIVNMRTAKSLGLSIPQAMPLRADEVIE